ncbi:MAG TPA: response regulator [Lacipirellulaceae bacterium]|nr:response regulator [Lacipirellulaceae bacterium]
MPGESPADKLWPLDRPTLAWADRAAEVQHVNAHRKTVLLVEEEPALLDITAFRLELLGYVVQAHATAESALAWLSAAVPDLIAVGYLSDIDSVELLNRISDDPRTSGTPLLYLSANSDLDEVQRAYNAGADEYLLTPYDPLMLERKVQGLLAAADLQQAN